MAFWFSKTSLSKTRRHAARQAEDVARAPTLFAAEETARHLKSVHARNEPLRAAGKSVIFLTEAMEARRVTTPTLLAAMNTLEPGGAQRPHKHSSAALTLAIKSEGVYSMVGETRIDWVADTVMVTPPGAVHSHHNGGPEIMRSFVIQDTGLHTELRTTNFFLDGLAPRALIERETYGSKIRT